MKTLIANGASDAGAKTVDDAKDEDDKKNDEAPKVEVKVLDNDGEVIRTYKTTVHQGINRITWDMRRDGSRSMPSAEEADYTDGLPAGPEVPPGTYRVQLTLKNGDTDTRDEIAALVVNDPRSPYSQADIEQNYRARLELLEMTRRNVAAVERIVATRDDVKAIKTRVAKREDSEQKKALTEAADAAIKRLDELEKLFRVPPETKGIVYDDNKVSSQIGTANYYVSSTLAPPSPAARVFVDIARTALDSAVAESDRWFADELPALKTLVDDAGIGFLTRSAAN